MSSPHWLTGEIIDENTTPWILGINNANQKGNRRSKRIT